MADLNLIEIGKPGTIEEFQKNALRRWGFDFIEGLNIDRLSREQAAALHQCALYLEHVYREETGMAEIPVPAMCAGLLFILDDPSRHGFAAKWVNEMATMEPWEGKDNPHCIRDELYFGVADAMYKANEINIVSKA